MFPWFSIKLLKCFGNDKNPVKHTGGGFHGTFPGQLLGGDSEQQSRAQASWKQTGPDDARPCVRVLGVTRPRGRGWLGPRGGLFRLPFSR